MVFLQVFEHQLQNATSQCSFGWNTGQGVYVDLLLHAFSLYKPLLLAFITCRGLNRI